MKAFVTHCLYEGGGERDIERAELVGHRNSLIVNLAASYKWTNYIVVVTDTNLMVDVEVVVPENVDCRTTEGEFVDLNFEAPWVVEEIVSCADFAEF